VQTPIPPKKKEVESRMVVTRSRESLRETLVHRYKVAVRQEEGRANWEE
jgi:hypothetical protein